MSVHGKLNNMMKHTLYSSEATAPACKPEPEVCLNQQTGR